MRIDLLLRFKEMKSIINILEKEKDELVDLKQLGLYYEFRRWLWDLEKSLPNCLQSKEYGYYISLIDKLYSDSHKRIDPNEIDKLIKDYNPVRDSLLKKSPDNRSLSWVLCEENFSSFNK